MNRANKASVVYKFESVWSILWHHIHNPHIFAFQSSSKGTYVCLHVHYVPKCVGLNFRVQQIPVILNSLLPNFLQHITFCHKPSSRVSSFLGRHIYRQDMKLYMFRVIGYKWRITVSLLNVSVENPKSDRRGGGLVSRAGQGAKPLPFALWISKNLKKIVWLEFFQFRI